MNPRVSTQKIPIMEILDSSFSLYSTKIEAFFIIFLLLNSVNAALVHIAVLFLPKFNPPYGSTDSFFTWLTGYGVTAIIVLSLLFVAVWVITNIGSGLIVQYILEVLEGKRADLKRSLTSLLHFLGQTLVISFLTGTLTVLGFILLVFPGVIMMVMFSLAIPALISERLGIFDSLRRSKELTDNMWWRTFLLLLAIFTMFTIAYLLAEVLTVSFYQIYQQNLARTIVTLIIISLIEPIYPISITQLYYRIKRLKALHPSIKVQEYMPPRISETEIGFCYNCGQVLPYDAIYCPNCGMKVRAFD